MILSPYEENAVNQIWKVLKLSWSMQANIAIMWLGYHFQNDSVE